MILTSLPHKSKMAFLMSAEVLAEMGPKLYFWTFTWAEEGLPTEVYRRTWNRFTVALRRFLPQTFAALRVWELHPGGHGLHVHMLTNTRIDVNLVRILTQKAGMGKVCHVYEAHPGSAPYMAKYMRKGAKIRGVKIWSKLGKWDHVKCGNLVFESEDATLLRSIYHAPEMDRLPPSQRWVQTQVQFDEIKRRIFREECGRP